MAIRDRALAYLEVSARVQRAMGGQESAAADLDEFLNLPGATQHRSLADAYRERAELLTAVIAELRGKKRRP